MAGPIDGAAAIHNAFRADMAIIDAAVLDAGTREAGTRGDGGEVPVLQRGAGAARSR